MIRNIYLKEKYYTLGSPKPVTMRATVIFLLFASFTLGDEYHPRLKKSVKKSQENLDNEDINYWVDKGKNEIERAKNLRNNIIEKRAKNVIIFVGDGMSLPTLTAARIYKAQKADRFKENTNAEGGLLYFEGFPHVGLSKVFYSSAGFFERTLFSSARFFVRTLFLSRLILLITKLQIQLQPPMPCSQASKPILTPWDLTTESCWMMLNLRPLLLKSSRLFTMLKRPEK